MVLLTSQGALYEFERLAANRAFEMWQLIIHGLGAVIYGANNRVSIPS